MNLTVEITAWAVAGCLMVVGLAGTFLPVLPGTFLILAGAVAFKLILWEEAGIGWTGLVILTVLFALSALVDFLSGALGAKWFGASRWGALGAVVGGIIGLFFSIIGILIGPIIGAIAFEIIFARKEWRPAGKSGVGTVIGGAAGLAAKLVLAAAMIAWFLVDVLVIESV